MNRMVDIQGGILMVVTDLHGDWDAYQRYRDRFLGLQSQGNVDFLLITGDLIHYTGPASQDGSLKMILDLISLKETFRDRVIYLLGNHELPHIYSLLLRKGEHLFTPRFQHVMGERRAEIVSFFERLPFFVRTPGGVSLCHAGASTSLSSAGAYSRLLNFSHQRVKDETVALVSPEKWSSLRRELADQHGMSYDEMARAYLDVSGADDPRYDDFLIGSAVSLFHPDWRLLWKMVSTRNELEYGPAVYPIVLEESLKQLSVDSGSQTVLVSGHMDCGGGYTIVDRRQLRIASAKNASPREAGKYLLLDSEQKVDGASGLVPGLGTVFA